jgi:hypothetical protein
MLNIKKQLYNDITAYCKVNEITDVDKFCSDLLEKAFVTEKYGSAPQIIGNKNVDKKIDKPLVYEPEISVSLQPEQIEIPKEEPPKKIFKKLNLNDDYKTYDFQD